MNSFTSIFQGFYVDFKDTLLSPLCSPMYWLKPLPHPIKFWRAPMFSTPVENPEGISNVDVNRKILKLVNNVDSEYVKQLEKQKEQYKLPVRKKSQEKKNHKWAEEANKDANFPDISRILNIVSKIVIFWILSVFCLYWLRSLPKPI